MIITIHQPQFMPWAGYFDKMFKSDVFVFLDNVQYIKNEFKNRNKILLNSNPLWLTLPVRYKFGQQINEIKIENFNIIKRKHLRTLELAYKKSDFFDEFYEVLKYFYDNIPSDNLSEINIFSIKCILNYLEIKKNVFLSSELKINYETPTQRLVEICKYFNAEKYISGPDGRKYMEIDLFQKNNIDLLFHKYIPKKYNQINNKKNFVDYLSIIDIIFNCGKKQTIEYLKNGELIK